MREKKKGEFEYVREDVGRGGGGEEREREREI